MNLKDTTSSTNIVRSLVIPLRNASSFMGFHLSSNSPKEKELLYVLKWKLHMLLLSILSLTILIQSLMDFPRISMITLRSYSTISRFLLRIRENPPKLMPFLKVGTLFMIVEYMVILLLVLDPRFWCNKSYDPTQIPLKQYSTLNFSCTCDFTQWIQSQGNLFWFLMFDLRCHITTSLTCTFFLL